MSDSIDIDAEAAPRRLEFVCDTCLFSAYASGAGPWPRCPRCGIRLTPDSDEPPARRPLHRVFAAKKAPP
jgi:hypothetical protein